MNEQAPVVVNDRQSLLNETTVALRIVVKDEEDVRGALSLARRQGLPVSVCGGRHAMGGQQFAQGGVLLDMTGFAAVRELDTQRGLVTVEAGVLWPDLMDKLDALQPGAEWPWVIRQKQTGVDDVSIGGSLAANAHGRGLRMPPMVADCEAFTLMDDQGVIHRCSREENAELFSLAIGGYGGFGIMLTATLRLSRRSTVRRHVEVIEISQLVERATVQYQSGAVYGDCQFATHLSSDAAHHPSIFSCYLPDEGRPDPEDPGMSLSADQWRDLVRLARRDKPAAFDCYCKHYSRTHGRKYASDRHQLSPVFKGYLAATRSEPDKDCRPRTTEMITEVYVDPGRLMDFLLVCRHDFVEHNVDMTYGTIRLIEPDTDTFLPWASQRWACVVVNLRVEHNPDSIAGVRQHFRRILDRVVEHTGSFYLTYHRWAQRRHLDAVYPQMPAFLALKRAYDPHNLFTSNWYRHLFGLYPEAAV